LLSLFTALTFVAYFYNVHSLVEDIASLSVSISGLVWIGLFALMTYLNAGWLREQVCKHMCPYSRIQSAMYDDSTLLVAYDTERGEGRGARKPGSNYREQGLGDCIDCNWCVQVCPADIDIRDGLQAECIDCGLCIDACDSVMDKMGYEKGLIKFSAANGETSALKRFFNPKMLAYCLVLLSMMMAFTFSLSDRIPLQVDVIRDRGAHMFRDRNGYIENVYLVKLNNMMDHADTVTLSVRGDRPYKIRGNKSVYLEAGEVFTLAVRLVLKKEYSIQPREMIVIKAQSDALPDVVAEQKTVFMGPSPK
jgi:cytochrome c oxidase accessory protein FixG